MFEEEHNRMTFTLTISGWQVLQPFPIVSWLLVFFLWLYNDIEEQAGFLLLLLVNDDYLCRSSSS